MDNDQQQEFDGPREGQLLRAPMKSAHPTINSRVEVATTLGIRILTTVVVGLCLKGVWDVAWSDHFPTWFAPLFGLGVACILALTVHAAFAKSELRNGPSQRISLVAWGLLSISFICTTSLHSFFPFRPGVAEAWAEWSSLRFNLLLAAGGLITTLVLAAWHAVGHRRLACLALVYCAPLLLLPNDDCGNPFNAWWIEHIGASPLMYLPNVIAIVIALRVLRSEGSRFHLWVLAGVCAATLLLGMSHRTGIVW